MTDCGGNRPGPRCGRTRVERPRKAGANALGFAPRSCPMRDEERQQASREALEGAARDSETIGSSALARSARRVADHFAGRDAVGERDGGGTDPAELWGRRIGRALSLLGVVLLAYRLRGQARWW